MKHVAVLERGHQAAVHDGQHLALDAEHGGGGLGLRDPAPDQLDAADAMVSGAAVGGADEPDGVPLPRPEGAGA